MEVLEELPAFTAGYAYSLVSNMFVQRANDQLGTKHLMVLGIPQVVNSMTKHGAGLVAAIFKAVTSLLTQQAALLLRVRYRQFADGGLSLFLQQYTVSWSKAFRQCNPLGQVNTA